MNIDEASAPRVIDSCAAPEDPTFSLCAADFSSSEREAIFGEAALWVLLRNAGFAG